MDCEKKKHEHISIVDLSEEERDNFFKIHGCDITRKLHEERKKNGYYDLCKRDLVKEEKEKKDKEKDDQKNKIKEQEKEINDLKEYVYKQTELLNSIVEKLNKLKS